MKGDLSTLKKVCAYGSKVMLAGTFVLLAIAIAVFALGISSFFWEGGDDLLSGILGFDVEPASDLKVAACFMEYVFVFLLATETVRRIYLVMVSIQKEHSPFNETNTGRVLRLSQIYLVAAIAMGILGLLGPHGTLFAAFVFFGCILVSVILYSLALIVRYGSVLQNESDHTL